MQREKPILFKIRSAFPAFKKLKHIKNTPQACITEVNGGVAVTLMGSEVGFKSASVNHIK